MYGMSHIGIDTFHHHGMHCQGFGYESSLRDTTAQVTMLAPMNAAWIAPVLEVSIFKIMDALSALQQPVHAVHALVQGQACEPVLAVIKQLPANCMCS